MRVSLARKNKLAWQREGLTPGSDRFIRYRVEGRPSTIPGSFNNAIMSRRRAIHLYLLSFVCIVIAYVHYNSSPSGAALLASNIFSTPLFLPLT